LAARAALVPEIGRRSFPAHAALEVQHEWIGIGPEFSEELF
jgi:hypothetical protein